MADDDLVVVTGATGVIGRVIVPALARTRRVRAVDRRPAPTPPGVETRWGDLRKPRVTDEAVRGAHTVIHLAHDRLANHHWRGVRRDLRMAERLLTAARDGGVRRVVLASSVHTMRGHFRREPMASVVRGELDELSPTALDTIAIDAPPATLDPYGAGKIVLERLGRAASGVDLEVVIARFGGAGLVDRPENPESFVTHLSHRDLVRAVIAAVDGPLDTPSTTFYAVSDNTWSPFDLAPGRALGFEPVDDAEQFADQLGARESVGRRMHEQLCQLGDRRSDRIGTTLEHSLQAASRARRDGAPDEEVVAALCHDVGRVVRSRNHARLSAEMLVGHLPRRLVWAVRVHEDFMSRYSQNGWRRHKRLKWRWHPWYPTAERLVDRWDAPAADPGHATLPLRAFVPALHRVLDVSPREPLVLRAVRRVTPHRVRRAANRV